MTQLEQLKLHLEAIQRDPISAGESPSLAFHKLVRIADINIKMAELILGERDSANEGQEMQYLLILIYSGGQIAAHPRTDFADLY